MHYLPVALIGAPLLFGAFALRAARRRRRPPLPPAPDFADLLGEERAGYANYLFYFHTPRCFPCRRLSPRVEALAAQRPNVFKFDAGERPEVADRFGISETPTVVWVAQGCIEEFAVGATAGRECLERFAAQEGVDA